VGLVDDDLDVVLWTLLLRAFLFASFDERCLNFVLTKLSFDTWKVSMQKVQKHLNVILIFDKKRLLHRTVSQIAICVFFNFILMQYNMVKIMLNKDAFDLNFHEVLQVFFFFIFHILIGILNNGFTLLLYLHWELGKLVVD
jgi:hypothetical protein